MKDSEPAIILEGTTIKNGKQIAVSEIEIISHKLFFSGTPLVLFENLETLHLSPPVAHDTFLTLLR